MKFSMTRRCGVASDTSGEAAFAGAASSATPAGAGKRASGVLEIDAGQAIVLERDRPVRARELDAARVARIHRRRRLERAQRPVRELQRRDNRVLDFDRVEQRAGARVDADDRSPQVEHHVEGVNRLVDERAAAVERERAAPARAAVVFRRPVPLDPARAEDRPSQDAGLDERLERDDVRLQAVLEEDAEFHASLVGRRDQAVRALGGDVERLLDEDVQPTLRRRDPLAGMKRRRAPDGDDVHRTVIEKPFQAVVGDGAMRGGERLRLLDVPSVDRDDVDAGDRRGRARVRLADAACAEDADLHRISAL